MVLGILAFLHLGALQAAYGPSFAALQVRHGVGVAEVGTVVSAHFLGGFVGVLASGALLARFGYRRLMIQVALGMAIGGAAVGFATGWLAVLAGAALVGLGYGVSVVLYNFMFARAFAPAGASAVNLINGAFGVGAVAMPALIGLATAVLVARDPGRIAEVPPLVFGAATLLALAVVAMALRVPWLPPRTGARPSSHARAGGAATHRPPVAGAAALFSALLFMYVAAEVATTSWAPTHLTDAFGAARAALVVSVFWIAMTTGRFLAAAFAGRLRPGDLVLGAVALTLVGIVLARLPGLAFVGYAVVGLGLAPVFPTSVVWIERRFGDRAERVAPWILAAGSLGPVLGAPAVGVAVAAAGAAAVPTVLAGVFAALAAVVAVIWRGERAAAGGSGGRPPGPAAAG